MNKPAAFFVISAWNNDVSWVKEYTDNYIIFDKSNTLDENEHIAKIENVGYNIYDICYYIIENYDKLPDLIAFLEGNPFDHCKKDVFNKLIQENKFTPIEFYGIIPANDFEQRTKDGGFMEKNNNWYIATHNLMSNQLCKFDSFDDFMNKYFEDYLHLNWLIFAPGAQYIVEKQQILQYPKKFWYSLMGEVSEKRAPAEAFIIERGLYYIFAGTFCLRKEFYE
jgi:hypothetical protein